MIDRTTAHRLAPGPSTPLERRSVLDDVLMRMAGPNRRSSASVYIGLIPRPGECGSRSASDQLPFSLAYTAVALSLVINWVCNVCDLSTVPQSTSSFLAAATPSLPPVG